MTIELNNNVYADGGNDTETTPVVLVHGFPVDHRMWDECAAALRDQAVKQGVKPFAMWAPDMPGAGEGPFPSDEDSGGKDADGAFPYGLDRMADAYVDLLHAAGYGKAIWVGLSMGGYLILDIQRLHPEAVAALALCDTKTTGTHEPVMGCAVPAEADSTVKQSDAYCRQFETWINEQPADGIAWRERMAAGRPDLNDVLPNINVPVAVICGDKDPSSPPAVMKPVADAMTKTDVTMTVIDDCGHFSAYEHPDQVAAALLELVKRVG